MTQDIFLIDFIFYGFCYSSALAILLEVYGTTLKGNIQWKNNNKINFFNTSLAILKKYLLMIYIYRCYREL